MTCHARADRHEPDTIRCTVCRLAWDKNDPDPPTCPRTVLASINPFDNSNVPGYERAAQRRKEKAREREPFVSGLPNR